jgi:nucleoside 2-deoxyribosyltransferase/GNAT superfamily N-acetyltransferase
VRVSRQAGYIALMSRVPTVYLAGPDVFLPDARAAGARLKAICRDAGLEARFPLDADLSDAGAIAAANEALIRGCDGVLANLTPFRGPSADPGTVYEVGYARALGKAIVGYTEASDTFAERTAAWLERLGTPARRRADGTLEDGDGMAIESFGLIDNLMLPAGITDSAGVIVTPHEAAAADQSVFACAAERMAALLGAPYRLRAARLEDRERLRDLIERSARVLGAADYTTAQIEAALRGAFGVDSQLIVDGTYFVAETGARLIGCGGWSLRRTLFGGDAGSERDAARLDPRVDAARIRAFFVDPEHARSGIGRALLARCEAAAAAHGFTRLELMATRPGARLYAALGYRSEKPIDYPVAPGLTLEFVPMAKTLARTDR